MAASWIQNLEEYNRESKKYYIKLFSLRRPEMRLFLMHFQKTTTKKQVLKWDLEIFHFALQTQSS